MNAFRLAGDLSHLLAIILLLAKIWKSRSCAGISGKSQVLFALVFITRYLDLFTNFVSVYNTVMKVFFIVAACTTVYLIFFKFRATYDANHDSFRAELLVIPITGLAFLVNHEFSVFEGGDVNAEDKSGLTPLHLAVQNQHLRCAQLLLELGANIHTRTRNCVTPLHVAATSGNLPCVEAFLVRGAFINAQESWGQTPLVVATQKLRVEAMRTLLLHGADTEVKDFFHKQTALHCAASDNKSEEALLILLDAGCDVHARDGSGCSPLGVAVMHRFKRGASLLLEYGASLNEADKQKTPECSSLRRYVEEKSGTPRTLQQLCRVFVRKALSRVPPDKMSSFMLPEHIAQYIEAITLSDPESNCAPTTVTGLKQ